MTERSEARIAPSPRSGGSWMTAAVALRYLRYAAYLGWWASRTLPILLRSWWSPGGTVRSVWRHLPGLLQDLGPAFVKLGQLVATREDLLPPGLRQALLTLQEDARPLAEKQVHAAVAASSLPAGEPLWPLGFGSIAGVYRLEVPHQPPVAVKVRRPGVVEQMSADLAAIRAAVRLLAKLPRLRHLPLVEMLDYLATAVAGQVDLARERASLERLRATLGHLPVVIPRPDPATSGEAVLVMEYLPAFHQPEVAVRSGGGPERAARMLTVVLTMLFRSGFVHLDLHAGNFAWDRHGRLNIIDAGFVVQLSPEVRREFCEFFVGLGFGNGRRCAESILRSAPPRPGADVDAFVAEVSALVAGSHRLTARDFRVSRVVSRLFAIQRRYGIFLSSEFAAPVACLLVIEGAVRSWDPDLDLRAVAAPLVLGTLAQLPPLSATGSR